MTVEASSKLVIMDTQASELPEAEVYPVFSTPLARISWARKFLIPLLATLCFNSETMAFSTWD